jgi:hypothetical protein
LWGGKLAAVNFSLAASLNPKNELSLEKNKLSLFPDDHERGIACKHIALYDEEITNISRAAGVEMKFDGVDPGCKLFRSCVFFETPGFTNLRDSNQLGPFFRA